MNKENSTTIVYIAAPIDKVTGLKNAFSEEIFSTLSDDKRFFPLSPEVRSDDVAFPDVVFGRDLLQVLVSDVVLVDARLSCGIGVGAEIAHGKINGARIVAIVPEDSHYKRKSARILGREVNDWTHPFIVGLCDLVLTDVSCKAVHNTLIKESRNKIEWNMDRCMAVASPSRGFLSRYFEKSFGSDLVMKKGIAQSSLLSGRVNALSNWVGARKIALSSPSQ